MISEKHAIKIAEKVLKDIGFWDADVINPTVRLIDGENLSSHEKPYFLVSYTYGKEDFGQGNALVGLVLTPSSGDLVKKRVITRSGSIAIDYNEQDVKYFRV